jgi:glutamyl/glutaminyl-tRNA synthetase
LTLTITVPSQVEELVHKFDLSRIVKAAAVFDNKKLRWVNGQHLRKLPREELEAQISEHMKHKDMLPASTTLPGKNVWTWKMYRGC